MDTPATETTQDLDPAAAFAADVIAGLLSQDDFAARELLAAGWPLYHVEADTPQDEVSKEHLDGRRQYVRGVGAAEQVVRDI